MTIYHKYLLIFYKQFRSLNKKYQIYLIIYLYYVQRNYKSVNKIIYKCNIHVHFSMDKPGYRILFPEEWPELSLTEKLNEIANLDEYVFCHQNRTSVRCSEEAAVKMCRIAKEIYSSKTKK